MRPRTIAIGDIHGCREALDAIIEWIRPQSDDTLITLGDYVGGGGQKASGVLDSLIDLAKVCHLVPLRGNHDQAMLDSRNDPKELQIWLDHGRGGKNTLDSYGSIRKIPDRHFEFLDGCKFYYKTRTHFFVHANYNPYLSLDKQDRDILLGRFLWESIPEAHFSGKIAVMGHTPLPELLNLDHLICLDTGCGCDGWHAFVDEPSRIVVKPDKSIRFTGVGWLSALDVLSGTFWQVDERDGQPRQACNSEDGNRRLRLQAAPWSPHQMSSRKWT